MGVIIPPRATPTRKPVKHVSNTARKDKRRRGNHQMPTNAEVFNSIKIENPQIFKGKINVAADDMIRVAGDTFTTPKFKMPGASNADVPGWVWKALIYAFDHPDSVQHIKELTEDEKTICRLAGAKWVTKNRVKAKEVICETGIKVVEEPAKTAMLWTERPFGTPGLGLDSRAVTYSDCVGVKHIGELSAELFPSIEDGECVFVGEVDE